MTVKTKNIIREVLIWLFFLSLPFFIPRLIFHHEHHEAPPHHHEHHFHFPFRFLFFNASLVAFYYFNSLVLIPRFLAQRRRVIYALCILACFFFIFLLPDILLVLNPPFRQFEPSREVMAIHFLISTLLFSVIFMVSTGVKIIKEWYRSEQQMKEVLLEKTITELSFLKAQINPHFLFNTLNNIYSLSLKKSDHAPEAIIILSDMMRYVLNDAQRDTVDLDMEIDYVSKYIELQKLRLTDMVTIEYEVSGQPDGLVIAPLILMPFIENAFKFGISTDEHCIIQISITIADGRLHLLVSNGLFSKDNQVEHSSGIGIVNARRRLELLYPDKHDLKIKPNKDNKYTVHLDINLS